MEDNIKAFEAVNIGFAGVETGSKRFENNSHLAASPVAYWRVNLTALSQIHNLYFVASRDEIHVYEPSFPYQTLGSKRSLTITPQLANENAQGYIHRLSPHSINHLIVGDLGHQEILLLGTDSGNVVAYHTSAIVNAIGKNPYTFSTTARAELAGLRPFFSQWLYESTWGLAIHANARMIAVSANTPYHVQDVDEASKITVFAFALAADENAEPKHVSTGSEDNSGSQATEWVSWNEVDRATEACIPTRDRNYKIVLKGADGHMNNVPCVSFINNGSDTNGSWLLSTDINGVLKMWQIWRGTCAKSWDFSDRGVIGATWLRRWECGWQVAALDSMAFRAAENMHKFIGWQRAHQYYGSDQTVNSFDLSNVVRHHVPSNSLYHPAMTDVHGDGESEIEQDELAETLTETEETMIGHDAQSTGRAERVPGFMDVVTNQSGAPSFDARHSSTREPQSVHRRASTTSSANSNSGHQELPENHHDDNDDNDDDNDDNDNDETDESDEDDDHDFRYELDALEELAEGDVEYEEAELNSDFSEDADSDTGGRNGSSVSFRSSTSISSYNPRNSQDGEILRTGTSAIAVPSSPQQNRNRLKRKSQSSQYEVPQNRGVQIPNVPILHCSTSHLRLFNGPQSRFPHLFCARILKQMMPPVMEGSQLAQTDRLNMLAQIPELGIVVVASQIGRAAVCTLTKRKSDGLLGLRVDWMLPTKKQEKANLRPLAQPLLGIAVGPIQGRAPANASELGTDNCSWAQDRTIQGTATTFDPHTVDLKAQSWRADRKTKGSNAAHWSSDDEAAAGNVVLKPHRWTHARRSQDESWRAVEPSRRYRLMMTYADHTVLTYELSRGVEKEDIRAEESALEEVD